MPSCQESWQGAPYAFIKLMTYARADHHVGAAGCLSLLGLAHLAELGSAGAKSRSLVPVLHSPCIHAGRLNVLANVVRKPMQQIFSEFTGIKSGDQTSFSGTGDVKYHLGTSYDRPTITGKRVHLSLLANTSHLEVGSTV